MMRKSEEVAMILEALMIEGVMIDDRIEKAVKEGIKEIRRERFREKQLQKRVKFQKMEKARERRK